MCVCVKHVGPDCNNTVFLLRLTAGSCSGDVSMRGLRDCVRVSQKSDKGTSSASNVTNRELWELWSGLMDQQVSLKSLTLLYSDVSKTIYFNSTTESTKLSFHFSSWLCAQSHKRKTKTSGDKMLQRETDKARSGLWRCRLNGWNTNRKKRVKKTEKNHRCESTVIYVMQI